MFLLLPMALLVDPEHHPWLPTLIILVLLWIGQQLIQLCHVLLIRNPLQSEENFDQAFCQHY